MKRKPSVNAVLFDLDGTLLDTAPDMAAAINRLLAEQGQAPLPYDRLRPVVSHGARGLIDTAFGNDLDDDYRGQLTSRFLEIYAAALAIGTRPFAGVEQVLSNLDADNVPWGIVTNKPEWLTLPLLSELDFAVRSGCVICGDSLEYRKPHPAPLQHAAELLETQPVQCLYVGDAERDIEAGRAAGMTTLIAGYGYILEGEHPGQWQADGFLNSPQELLTWLSDHAA